ncbi:MAG: hypothetical protein GAK29_01022 [Acinetobacter bereziniae]|uniref:Uncharacterized protein n=1 Tax=Acinetobacter bereziniae TaxID=106648 RepID=A0A833URJ2_ACIBZ|nr:MAG: hypothetical protein GAK29_01022 [Acinetobacter bereziniae]
MLVENKSIRKTSGCNLYPFEKKIERALIKLDKNSELNKAIDAENDKGTIVKGITYVDKAKEKLMMIRIDPVKKSKGFFEKN